MQLATFKMIIGCVKVFVYSCVAAPFDARPVF